MPLPDEQEEARFDRIFLEVRGAHARAGTTGDALMKAVARDLATAQDSLDAGIWTKCRECETSNATAFYAAGCDFWWCAYCARCFIAKLPPPPAPDVCADCDKPLPEHDDGALLAEHGRQRLVCMDCLAL